MSVKTSDIFIEFNKTDVKDEQFDEYFYNKNDFGQVLRELIHLLTVPKVMIVLDQKLSEGLIIA